MAYGRLTSIPLSQGLFSTLFPSLSLSSASLCSTLSSSAIRFSSFRSSDLHTVRRPQLLPKPTKCPDFGVMHTDYMLEVEYAEGGWGKPLIRPYEEIQLDPMAKVLHYATSVFEGLKAFRGSDDKIRVFRIDENMKRMVKSAKRATLPEFCPVELEELICELVRMESEWVPAEPGSSLYIRPLLFGTDPSIGINVSASARLLVICTPVGAYFKRAMGLTLLADPSSVRSFPGGAGAFKMSSNYAPTIAPARDAAKRGCHQVLWLFGEDQKITEAGVMNFFVIWKNKQGEIEMVTAPLSDGLILPGITRDSILTIAREWNEFKVSEEYPTMQQIRLATQEGRVLEVFGAGTASVVARIGRIVHVDGEGEETLLLFPTPEDGISTRLRNHILDIQHGKVEKSEWTRLIL